jgi:hypothetical protein
MSQNFLEILVLSSIAKSLSVAAILVEASSVYLYFCRKLKESFDLCESQIKLNFVGLKCFANKILYHATVATRNSKFWSL